MRIVSILKCKFIQSRLDEVSCAWPISKRCNGELSTHSPRHRLLSNLLSQLKILRHTACYVNLLRRVSMMHASEIWFHNQTWTVLSVGTRMAGSKQNCLLERHTHRECNCCCRKIRWRVEATLCTMEALVVHLKILKEDPLYDFKCAGTTIVCSCNSATSRQSSDKDLRFQWGGARALCSG